MYRIEIDWLSCSGFGICAQVAGDLIEVGKDGIAAVRVGRTTRPFRPRGRGGLPDGRDHRRRGGGRLMTPRSVVIVGAERPGARWAGTLRAAGYDGAVTLIGEEALAPYERPALSKEYLAGRKERRELLLRPHASWIEQQIVLRLGERIVGVDPAHRTVVTEAGGGARLGCPRACDGRTAAQASFAVPSGVHTLRTVEDARVLREALVPGAHLVVVGGESGRRGRVDHGPIGSRVTMVEALAHPVRADARPQARPSPRRPLPRSRGRRARAHGRGFGVRGGRGRRRPVGSSHRRRRTPL